MSIGEFNLIVALPPVIVQPTPLEECDDEVADETTEFDLTIKNDEITAGIYNGRLFIMKLNKMHCLV